MAVDVSARGGRAGELRESVWGAEDGAELHGGEGVRRGAGAAAAQHDHRDGGHVLAGGGGCGAALFAGARHRLLHCPPPQAPRVLPRGLAQRRRHAPPHRRAHGRLHRCPWSPPPRVSHMLPPPCSHLVCVCVCCRGVLRAVGQGGRDEQVLLLGAVSGSGGPRRPGVAAAHRLRPPLPRRGSAPVSYTHLRAHETEADL
eukprot:2031316-Rhodomonas_salina.1